MADKAGAVTPPRAKKLPFKPTALRRGAPKPTPKDDNKEKQDNDLDLFSRSKEMFPIFAADRERRWKRKQRQLEEEERKRDATTGKRPLEAETQDIVAPQEPESSDARRSEEPPKADAEVDAAVAPALEESMTVVGDSFNELVTPPPSKRSKIESGTSRRYSAGIETVESTECQDASPSARRLEVQQKLGTQKPSVHQQSGTPSSSQAIFIESESESDSEPEALAASTPTRDPRSSIEILEQTPIPMPFERGSEFEHEPEPEPEPEYESEFEDPEEDEFAEYERRAAAQREREQALIRAGSRDPQTREPVEILVTTTIPGAQSLLVRFLFHKPLRIVRETWFYQQLQKGVDLGMEEPNEVILTWRGIKIYNIDTLAGLNIRSQPDGSLTAGGLDRTGFDGNRARVVLQAWTLELFQKMEHDKELERRREAGELSEEEEERARESEEPEEVKFRVRLRARDHAEVGLTVRPGTTAETLLMSFRCQRNVGSDQLLSLWFDGKKLEEHVTMEDAEIEEMDVIEVHIK